jgi:hypothetical protein
LLAAGTLLYVLGGDLCAAGYGLWVSLSAFAFGSITAYCAGRAAAPTREESRQLENTAREFEIH